MTEAEALDANFAELLAWYASFPGGMVERTGHAWICHSGVAFRALNAACRLRDGVERRIDEVTATLAAPGMPWRWLVGGSSRPTDLGDRLVAAGLAPLSDNPGMALDLDGFTEEPPPTGVTIERVSDEPGLARWREVNRRGLDLDPVRDEAWWIAHRRPGFADDAPLVNYVASLDGAPVAAAALFDGAGVAGIYNVATVPEARGRGIGRAVTAAAIAEGVRRGLRMAVLGSSEMGFPVYRRLGFREVSRLRSFGPPA
jgi:ribosomal protein S18 acetylase RimI-like enzyme